MLGEYLVLRLAAFLLFQTGCAEWVGGILLKWDSRRTCGYFRAREHTSAATMTVKMVLERLWRYAGEHSCFFRGGSRIRGDVCSWGRIRGVRVGSP